VSNRQEKERRRREREQAQADAASAAANRKSNIRFAAGVGVAVLAAAAIVIAGTHSGSSAGGGGPALTPVAARPAAASPSATAAPRPRSPKSRTALAELKAQGNQVISGDVGARLAKLHGVPVVVNMWASWCPNCRAEFGYFQSLSKAYNGKVAFLGLDSNDSRSDAESFLKKFPIPYPSIEDPGAAQARSIGAGLGWPTTLFYDATGKQRFVRQGGYTTQESLDADIHAYALG
jgi:thiol-disulfide isomerase/thioredoxin